MVDGLISVFGSGSSPLSNPSPLRPLLRLRSLHAPPQWFRLPPDFLHFVTGGRLSEPGADPPDDPSRPQGGLHLPGQRSRPGREERDAVPRDTTDQRSVPVRRAEERQWVRRALGHITGPQRQHPDTDSLHQLDCSRPEDVTASECMRTIIISRNVDGQEIRSRKSKDVIKETAAEIFC